MKKSAYLSMLELIVMTGVFFLICAGVLQLFSHSYVQGLQEKELSLAAFACANQIEEIKNEKKLPEGALYLDRSFEKAKGSAVYEVAAEPLLSESPYLEKARVSVRKIETGTVLYQAECAWQVDRHE